MFLKISTQVFDFVIFLHGLINLNFKVLSLLLFIGSILQLVKFSFGFEEWYTETRKRFGLLRQFHFHSHNRPQRNKYQSSRLRECSDLFLQSKHNQISQRNKARKEDNAEIECVFSVRDQIPSCCSIQYYVLNRLTFSFAK